MFIESFLAEVLPSIRGYGNLLAIANATILDIIVFILIIHFTVHRYKDRLVAIGLSARNFFKNVFYGIVGYVALLPVLAVMMLLILVLVSVCGYRPPMQPVLKIFLEEKQGPWITYFMFFVAIFGPLVEETFFRGFMYPAVKRRWGLTAALLATSAVFALLHANLIGFFPILVLGLLLAYLYEKTGTIVASCAVHIVHNTAMLAFVFIMKGMAR